MEDYLKWYEDTSSSDFTNLYSRMDKDKSLYYLDEYVMKGFDGQRVPNVINMTLNDPLTFAKKTISTLDGANMQTAVESDELKDRATTVIERFLEDIFRAIDDRLKNRDIAGLFHFNCEQICVRGGVVARCLMRMDGKDFVPDVLPIDRRFFVYERGVDGFLCAGFRTSRSKNQIEDEYGQAIEEERGIITDIWDKKWNITYVGEEQVRHEKNPYGYPPFVVGLSTAGSMLWDDTGNFHAGESIYTGNRNLYEHLNRAATILQTLNEMTFRAPMQLESEAGTQAKKPAQPPYGVGAVVPVDMGAGYKAMPVADIKQATRVFYSVLDSRLQRASLPTIDYGTLTFPLSAVAITQLTATKDDLFIPLLQGIAIYYQQLAEMIISQYISQRIKSNLGLKGHKAEYGFKDLEGDYSLSYRFFAKSPEQDVANYAIAGAAKDHISSDRIRRQILKLDDPDAEEAKMLAEDTERISPEVKLYRRACALIDEDRDIEARLVANSLVALLKQRRMGPAEGQAVMPTPGGNGQGGAELMPLLGKGGGTKGRPELRGQSAEVRRIEQEEEASM